MPGTPSIAIFQWPCVAILENARTLYLLHNASVFSLVTSKREKQQAYPLITVVYDSPHIWDTTIPRVTASAYNVQHV